MGKLFWHTGPDGIHLTPSCVNFPDTRWFDISREDLMTGACTYFYLRHMFTLNETKAKGFFPRVWLKNPIKLKKIWG